MKAISGAIIMLAGALLWASDVIADALVAGAVVRNSGGIGESSDTYLFLDTPAKHFAAPGALLIIIVGCTIMIVGIVRGQKSN